MNRPSEPGLRVTLTVGYAAIALYPAFLAWSHSKTRLDADAAGLHVIQWPRTTTYRWQDIAETRPSILKVKRTTLVLVRRHGQNVDLPVADEHLDALRRWHDAAG